jgi:hypothetical protein
MSYVYFNMTQKRNVGACNGSQSHHQGPNRLEKFKIKTMLIKYFDKQGVIHKQFVPEGQAVNSDFYVEVIRRLLKRISWVRPQFRAEGSWFLLHSNAPSHSALVVKTFLAKHGVVEISHPPYSPDLGPVDFSSFLQ